MICSELGETRCRISRLRARGVTIAGGGAGVVPPPGCVSEDEVGRIGGRGGGPFAPASAQVTEAQIISAPHELNVLATAPWKIR